MRPKVQEPEEEKKYCKKTPHEPEEVKLTKIHETEEVEFMERGNFSWNGGINRLVPSLLGDFIWRVFCGYWRDFQGFHTKIPFR